MPYRDEIVREMHRRMNHGHDEPKQFIVSNPRRTADSLLRVVTFSMFW